MNYSMLDSIWLHLYKPLQILSEGEKGIRWMKRESYMKCEMSDPNETVYIMATTTLEQVAINNQKRKGS